jgi:hypothetical protein
MEVSAPLIGELTSVHLGNHRFAGRIERVNSDEVGVALQVLPKAPRADLRLRITMTLVIGAGEELSEEMRVTSAWGSIGPAKHFMFAKFRGVDFESVRSLLLCYGEMTAILPVVGS